MLMASLGQRLWCQLEGALEGELMEGGMQPPSLTQITLHSKAGFWLRKKMKCQILILAA